VSAAGILLQERFGQKGSMGRRVLVIVLLVVVALLAYAGYSSYDARRAGVTGQVFSNDSTADRVKVKPAVQSAQPQEPETIVYPSTTPAATTAPGPVTTATAAPIAPSGQVTQGQQSAQGTAPASDTISPNPPDGMTFAGSGRYQLYRQGNITWRLDTETGRSCVIFATDEEWKKPRVYKAGCGRS
jgi:cytoskeletal protein RodZ